MGLTPRQHAIRSRHIGASEIAAVMGLDDYRGPQDVFLRKTGRLAADTEMSEAAQLGLAIEPALLKWCGEQIGERYVSNQLRVHKDGILSATHDALVRGKPIAIQAKTAGLLGPRPDSEEWGDEGTDQIPLKYLAQCHAECAVSDLERVYVPVLLGGIGRRLYVVERDEKMAELVIGWAAWMWGHIEDDRMPTGAPAKIETLKRLIRVPSKAVSIPDDVVNVWQTARNMRLSAEKIEAEAERMVLESLMDAEAGVSGVGTVTYFETERKNKALPASVSRFRTLRLTNKEIADGGAEGSADRGQDAGGADGARLAAERPRGGLSSGADVRPVGAGAEGDGAS